MSDAEQAAYWKEAYTAMALIVDIKNIEIAKLREGNGDIMSELEKAIVILDTAEQASTFPAQTSWATVALAHAAIAQAEQLERIADLLEQSTSGGTDYNGSPMRVFRTEQLG